MRAEHIIKKHYPYELELKRASELMLTRSKKRFTVSRVHGRRIYRQLRKALRAFSKKYREEDALIRDLIYQRRYLVEEKRILPVADLFAGTSEATKIEKKIDELLKKRSKIAKEYEKTQSAKTLKVLTAIDEKLVQLEADRKIRASKKKKWDRAVAKRVFAYTNCIIKIRPSYNSKFVRVFAIRSFKQKDIIMPKSFALQVVRMMRRYPKIAKKKFTVKLRKVGSDEYRVIVNRKMKCPLCGKVSRFVNKKCSNCRGRL